MTEASPPASAPSAEPSFDMSVAILFSILLAVTDANDHMTQNYLAVDYTAKGISYTKVGVLLGAPLLFAVLFAVAGLIPAMMRAYGGAPKFALLCMLVIAGSRLLLAPIALLKNPDSIFGWTLSNFMLAMPGFAGLDIAAGTSIYCSVPQEGRIAANAKFVMGRFFGAMLGPPLGGAFYQVGGFAAPPLVGGAAILALCWWKREELQSLPPYVKDAPTRHIMTVPGAAVAAVCLACGFGLTYYPITYLPAVLNTSFGITPIWFGAVVLAGLGFAIVCFGLLEELEKEVPPVPLILGFGVLSLIGFVLMGSPLFPPTNLWRILIGYWLVNAGVAGPMVCAGPLMIKYATRQGFSEEDAAAQTAAMEVVLGGFGAFVAASVAGWAMDAVGFMWANMVGIFLPATIIGVAVWLHTHDSDLGSKEVQGQAGKGGQQGNAELL